MQSLECSLLLLLTELLVINIKKVKCSSFLCECDRTSVFSLDDNMYTLDSP